MCATHFAQTARAFCAWATSPPAAIAAHVAVAGRHLAALVGTGFALCEAGEGEPAEREVSEEALAAVRRSAEALPLQFYSEIFDSLSVPPGPPVVGDLVDDLVDIYKEIALGRELFDAGRTEEAEAHWRFWFPIHWGEHATSALRALWAWVARANQDAEAD